MGLLSRFAFRNVYIEHARAYNDQRALNFHPEDRFNSGWLDAFREGMDESSSFVDCKTGFFISGKQCLVTFLEGRLDYYSRKLEKVRLRGKGPVVTEGYTESLWYAKGQVAAYSEWLSSIKNPGKKLKIEEN